MIKKIVRMCAAMLLTVLTVTPAFAVTYNITSSASTGGSISPAGVNAYTAGQPYIADTTWYDPGQEYIAPYYDNPGQPYIAPSGYHAGQSYIAPTYAWSGFSAVGCCGNQIIGSDPGYPETIDPGSSPTGVGQSTSMTGQTSMYVGAPVNNMVYYPQTWSWSSSYMSSAGQPYIAPYYDNPGQPYIAPSGYHAGQAYIAPSSGGDPGQPYIAPANPVYTITASSGYAVSSVLVDGVNQGATTSYMFNNVQAVHTISASFISSGTTTLGTGTDPASITILPNDSATSSDAFTFQTSTSTDTITAVLVGIDYASSTKLIEITNDAGTIVYGSSTNPTGTTTSISLTTNIVASTTLTQYKIRITPKTVANLPTGDLGVIYPVTTKINSITSGYNKIGTDTASAVISINNLAPVLQGGTASIWTSRAAAADNNWNSVTYGAGLFVAVSDTGTNNRVMTSPDGITWTSRTSAYNSSWKSVTYANGIFVAVGSSLFGRGVMTSPDGITWTLRSAAYDNNWTSVTYGAGLFVAVANSGFNTRVMTSPDGITWTRRTSVTNNSWTSVTYGSGLFVAVADSGTNNRVMTSPDGITWTSRTSAANNNWTSVAYGNGLFVAVANSGTGNRIMTSSNGTSWTTRTSPADNNWTSVTATNGLFVAVANSGLGNRVMTSSDGITWTTKISAADNDWRAVTYATSTYVAVANFYLSNPVMTSGRESSTVTPGDSQVTVNYVTPNDSSINSVIVLRSTSPILDTPVDGMTYNVGDVLGTSQGQAAYTTPGTYSWTAPVGVTSVSVVAVGGGSNGGGGLGWKNNITVVPGNSYSVVVGNYAPYTGNGGASYFIGTTTVAGFGSNYQTGGSYTGDGGGNGGSVVGGYPGAGAGGYTGSGGNSNAAGSGGGGGGGTTYSGVDTGGGGGGGVGILGQGSSGASDTAGTGWGGFGGSGGTKGGSVYWVDSPTNTVAGGGGGGSYGGGAGTGSGGSPLPGAGAVRIIWGSGRSFPSTNTTDMATTTAGATVACVDSIVTTSSNDSCTATGLTNGVQYYLKIFLKNSLGVYSVGVIPSGPLVTINATTNLDQSSYAFFASSTSYTPGASLAAQNTLATLTNYGDAFRLRMAYQVSTNALGISGKPLKLQYAVKSGTCDASFTGETYNDITDISPISFYDTPALANGTALGAQVDLTHGASTLVDQSYVESSSVFTNAQAAVPVGQDAKYDFSLYDNGAISNTSYCIRTVHADGSTLSSYTSIPEVKTAYQRVQLDSYRFRNDDGNESAASYIQSENSPVSSSLIAGDKVRLRMALSNQASSISRKTYQLEYSSGSCTVWTKVPRLVDAIGEAWRIEPITTVADNTVTTKSAGISVPGGKSFVGGKLQSFNSATYPVTLTSNEYTELEYSLRSTAAVVPFTPYCFRVTHVGDASDFTYLILPTVIVASKDYRRQGGGGLGGGVTAASAAVVDVVSLATTTTTGGSTTGTQATTTPGGDGGTTATTTTSTTTPKKGRSSGDGDVGFLPDFSNMIASINYVRPNERILSFDQTGFVLGDTSSICVDMKNRMIYGKRDTETGGEVSQLQYYLKKQGYFTGKVTGNYLSITEKAVKAFQKDNDLIVTGIAGKVTRDKMKELGCVK